MQVVDAVMANVSSNVELRRVGLLAGWGRFPIVVAEALRKQGHEVYCLGVKGHADPALATIANDFSWVGLGRLGNAIRYFRRHGVTVATMAGKIHKKLLLQPSAIWQLMPDWTTISCFYEHFLLHRHDRKDDTLLMAVVEAFARRGIVFGPATDYAPELLVKFGKLTRRGPTAAEQKDIEFGWAMAKEMGRLDVGQSVAVKGRACVAVEAVEGTDECIRRAGSLCRGGFTVVKVAKPQQDKRFDMPTIGLETVRTLIDSGARCMAIEAGMTVVIDQPEVARLADKHGLAIVALEHGEQSLAEPEVSHSAA